MARAAPPAPNSTTAWPAGSASWRSDSTKPLPSVFSPTSSGPTLLDAVDRTHEGGRLAQAIEMHQHRDLVRNRQVAAAKTHPAHAAHGVGQIGRSDFKRQIAPIEAGLGQHPLHDVLRWIAGHRLTQATDDFLNQFARHGTGGLASRGGSGSEGGEIGHPTAPDLPLILIEPAGVCNQGVDALPRRPGWGDYSQSSRTSPAACNPLSSSTNSPSSIVKVISTSWSIRSCFAVAVSK